MADPGLISDEDLARLLDGRRPEQVADAVEAAGADGLIRRVLGRLGDRLHLDAGDAGAVMRWDVAGVASTRSFHATAEDGRWVFSDGRPEAWSVAVALAVDDLLRLAAGRLLPSEAFLSGRLRLSGDLALAQRVLPGFDMGAGRPETGLTDPRPDRPSP